MQPTSFADPPFGSGPCAHCGKEYDDHQQSVETKEPATATTPAHTTHIAYCIGVTDKYGDPYEYEEVDPAEVEFAQYERMREQRDA